MTNALDPGFGVFFGAGCQAGATAIAGSCELEASQAALEGGTLLGSGNYGNPGGWQCFAKNFSASQIQVKAVATCSAPVNTGAAAPQVTPPPPTVRTFKLR